MDHLVDHIFIFEGNGQIKDYHSNYTEYRQTKEQQRKAEVRQQRDEKPRYERNRNEKAKATYKQQKEYESLTQEIEQLNNEKQCIEQKLSGLTNSTPEEITQASLRIGEILSLLDEKEMRWLEFDELM